MAQPIEGGKGYTYADYLTWDDGRRWEIIDGVAYEKIEGPSVASDMTPAPGRFHQSIVTNLIREIGIYLKGKPGRVFSAPFDVRLSESGNMIVVQPDLSIFCSDKNLDEKGATGAPDWVIEILSPYTSVYDLTTKFRLYQRNFVKEYWVVEPAKKTITAFILEDNKFGEGNRFMEPQQIQSYIFPDLKIDLREIFTK